MAQTSYVVNPAPGVAGMLADNRYSDNVSKLVKTAGTIRPGMLVGWGTDGYTGLDSNPGQCDVLPTGFADPTIDSVWIGVAMFDSTLPPMTLTGGVAFYDAQQAISVVRRGRIWVITETSVTEGADVYVRNTTAGAALVGQFRAGAAANFSLFPRGRWRSTSTAGIAVLEIGG